MRLANRVHKLSTKLTSCVEKISTNEKHLAFFEQKVTDMSPIVGLFCRPPKQLQSPFGSKQQAPTMITKTMKMRSILVFPWFFFVRADGSCNTRPSPSSCRHSSLSSFVTHHLTSSSGYSRTRYSLKRTMAVHRLFLSSPTEADENMVQSSKDIIDEMNTGTFTPPPYPLDDNGRPIDVRGNELLVFPTAPTTDDLQIVASFANLQTPHAGRKFRPTHPNSKSRSKFRARLKSILQWKRGTVPNNNLKKSNATKKRMLFSRNSRRFTEGWYYRLTLPEHNESFVFIFSIEDAGRWIRSKSSAATDTNNNKLGRMRHILQSLRSSYVKSPLTLACFQLLGPQDTYLVQSDEDDTKFWGWKYSQGLGCTFQWNDEGKDDNHTAHIAAMQPDEWRKRVQTGFQILPFHFQGRLNGHDGTLGGVKANQGIPGSAEYDISLKPVAGWGNYPPLSSATNSTTTNNNYRQYSTAGWLAAFPVFEPHWQITMAHARASGSLNWNGTVYEFEDAPFYGEKNWGGAFPTKWYWAQCNSFDDHQDLSFTAGGGIRELPFSFLMGKKKTETLGLIGIHYQGTFYEIVPWTGEMQWEVAPWGRWEFRGRCTDKNGNCQFEAEVVATTKDGVEGVLLRAPTKDEGMQYFCRDSGAGKVTLSLWLLEWDDDEGDYVRSCDKPPLIDRAQSSQCTVEVC